MSKHRVARRIVFPLVASTLIGAAHVAAAGPPGHENVIVVLRGGATSSDGSVRAHAVRHDLSPTRSYSRVIKGYAATVTPEQRKALVADADVAFVEVDRPIQPSGAPVPLSWGLDRIDQRRLPLDGRFTPPGTGAGVRMYIVDSGINLQHVDFRRRMEPGFDGIDGELPADDCFGHGTHVAGIAGGAQYGVARLARIVPVRVLDCDGVGTVSGLIEAIEWIAADHAAGETAVAKSILQELGQHLRQLYHQVLC